MYQTEKIELHTNDDEITCDLLVNAEGFNSALRESVHVKCFNVEYDCLAVASVMKPKSIDKYAAYQRFLPNGPIASLPMGDVTCVIWFMPHFEYSQYKSKSDDEIVTMVNEAFSTNEYIKNNRFLEMFANIQSKSDFDSPQFETVYRQTELSLPIITRLAYRFALPRIVFIGDCAHRMHPLAGQGANVGLEDVNELVDIIEYQFNTGHDIGSKLALDRYERKRQFYAYGKAFFMDSVYRIFSTSFLPTVMFRSAATQLFDRIPILNNFMLSLGKNG